LACEERENNVDPFTIFSRPVTPQKGNRLIINSEKPKLKVGIRGAMGLGDSLEGSFDVKFSVRSMGEESLREKVMK